MSQMTGSLNELVKALNDGIAFYDQALLRIGNPVYTDVFSRMRHLKISIAADLSNEIANEGEQAQSDGIEGTWLGTLRLNYADLVADFADHPRYSFVEQLLAQEERVLEAFRQASNLDSSARVKELAGLYLPEIQRMHEEMLDLKTLSALQVNNI